MAEKINSFNEPFNLEFLKNRKIPDSPEGLGRFFSCLKAKVIFGQFWDFDIRF